MNKNELIALVDSLNMPKNMYRILSGGSLVMMGIKEKTNDLDMSITSELFEILKNKYDIKKSDKDINDLFCINDLIEFMVEDEFEYTMVDNYPCEPLLNVLKFKEEKGRPKDLIDIISINDYIKRTS
jgi:hypothetical protein